MCHSLAHALVTGVSAAQHSQASGDDNETSSRDVAVLDGEDDELADAPDDSTDVEPSESASTALQSTGHAGDDWKYSVRVNVAAGSRDSVVLSHVGATEHDARTKRSVANLRDANARSEEQRDAATVRVLREPGDSGDSMYACLYGDRVVTTTDARESSEDMGEDSSSQVLDSEKCLVMEELEGGDEQEEADDVEMQDVASCEHDDSASDARGVSDAAEDAQSLVSSSAHDAHDARDSYESPPLLLDSLPDVHAFFAHDSSDDDVRVLKRALTPHVRPLPSALA